MEKKTSHSHQRLHKQHGDADRPIPRADVHAEGNNQEPDGRGAADYRDPLSVAVKAIDGVIGQAENEIARKATEREEQHPVRPIRGMNCHHSIHDEQQANSGVSQWRDERRRVGETLQSTFIEEAAIQVVNDSRQTHRHRDPSDDQSYRAPQPFLMPALSRQNRDQKQRRSQKREIERDVLRLPPECVFRMRHVDIEGEKCKIEQNK